MRSLLERSRLLHAILQGIDKSVDYLYELALNLTAVFECDIVIIGTAGSIVGDAKYRADLAACADSARLFEMYAAAFTRYHKNFLALNETVANLPLPEAASKLLDIDFSGDAKELWSVVPVYSGAERTATLVMCRYLRPFTEEELTLTEYGALVAAREVFKLRAEIIESDNRKRVAVRAALSSLSYSEREAIECIFRKLRGTEGNLVASKIADEIGITRSVIVSALRKFESARIIQSKSLGMKGTYIKVLNEFLFLELGLGDVPHGAFS